MNKLTTTILATALVGAISFTAFASVATANGPQRGGPQNAGPIHFVCNDKAAERMENGLTRMGERLDLTASQTAAFDTFKTSSISAQESFAEICVSNKPADAEAAKDLDLVDRLNNRQAMMSAQLNAMTDVMPDFEAFFDTLTDEQKAQMRPDRSKGQHRHGPCGNNGGHSHGQNSNGPANG